MVMHEVPGMDVIQAEDTMRRECHLLLTHRDFISQLINIQGRLHSAFKGEDCEEPAL